MMNSIQSSNDAGGGSVTSMESHCQQSSKFLRAKRRSLAQNDLLWGMLDDISAQVKWPVDGVEQFLPKEDWKVILTAGVKKEARIAAGVSGGFVMLGTPTSRMTVAEMTELIDFIRWFGDSKSVAWSDSPEAA